MPDLLQRLKQRKIVQWAVAYVAGAFALLQGVDIVAQQFGWPDALQRGITLAMVLGFFVALVLAWYHGERGQQNVSGRELLILAGVLAVGGGVLWRYAQTGQPETAENDSGPVSTLPGPAAEPTSIAVLPFANMSPDKAQDYFSDGLSEELLNQLAQVPQLRVIARTSSFSFKGKKVDIATIARALNVANVLEGSVRKDGDTLRITAQLIRAADSSHQWSQTYDRELTDILELQDEIAGDVVDALKLELLPAQRPISLQHTRNAGAYQSYLLGKEIELRGGDHPRGVQVLRHAVALDPGYANAWAELATALDELANNEASQAQTDHDLRQAFAAAERAIELAPDLSQGYASRGLLRYGRTWDWEGAQADFERGYALDPNNVTLLNYYASSLFFVFDRHEEGIAMSRRATTLDPLNPHAWEGLGRLLQADGQTPAADEAFRQAIQVNPGATWGHYLLGYDELMAGRAESALTHFRLILEDPWVLAGTAVAEYTLGNESASQRALEALRTQYAVGFGFQIAAIHAWRGETDQALEWLERAWQQRDVGMVRLRYDPTLVGLRDDSRFAALVKKMRFPE